MTPMPASRTLLLLAVLGVGSVLSACQTKGLGSPCEVDADCKAVSVNDAEKAAGAVAFCKLSSLDLTHTAGFTYPGGYCTKRCGFEGSVCGAGALCEYQAGLLGEYDNICLASCINDGECRPGYACLAASRSAGECLPLLPDGGVPEAVDAGPGTVGPAGAPCGADDACQPPAGGFCRQALGSDGGPSGFLAGECSAECGSKSSAASQGSWCGRGGSCAAIAVASGDGRGPVIRWECYLGCGGGRDAGCRGGYVCTATATPGVCIPDCHNEGAGCPGGSTCDVSGRCL